MRGKSGIMNWSEVEVCSQGWWGGEAFWEQLSTDAPCHSISKYFCSIYCSLEMGAGGRWWAWLCILPSPSDECIGDSAQILPLIRFFHLRSGRQTLCSCAFLRSAGTGSSSWEVLLGEIPEQKVLCHVTEVERNQLLELLAVLQKRYSLMPAASFVGCWDQGTLQSLGHALQNITRCHPCLK